MQIVRDAQDALGWISPATRTNSPSGSEFPRTRIESVVQFYSFFYDRPRGAYRLLLSDNITDRMQGSQATACSASSTDSASSAARSSPDGLVSVDLTSCTGLCDQGPALLVNERRDLAADERSASTRSSIWSAPARRSRVWPAEFFHIEDNVRRADALLGRAAEARRRARRRDRGSAGRA